MRSDLSGQMTELTISFHKKIHGAVNLSDNKIITAKSIRQKMRFQILFTDKNHIPDGSFIDYLCRSI